MSFPSVSSMSSAQQKLIDLPSDSLFVSANQKDDSRSLHTQNIRKNILHKQNYKDRLKGFFDLIECKNYLNFFKETSKFLSSCTPSQTELLRLSCYISRAVQEDIHPQEETASAIEDCLRYCRAKKIKEQLHFHHLIVLDRLEKIQKFSDHANFKILKTKLNPEFRLNMLRFAVDCYLKHQKEEDAFLLVSKALSQSDFSNHSKAVLLQIRACLYMHNSGFYSASLAIKEALALTDLPSPFKAELYRDSAFISLKLDECERAFSEIQLGWQQNPSENTRRELLHLQAIVNERIFSQNVINPVPCNPSENEYHLRNSADQIGKNIKTIRAVILNKK